MNEQTVLAVKALEVGVRGFPPRTLPIEEVLGPVRMLERARSPLTQARGLGLPCGSRGPAQQPGRGNDLLSRTEALCITGKTGSQIKRKLGPGSVTDLIHLAIATGPSTGSTGAKSRGRAAAAGQCTDNPHDRPNDRASAGRRGRGLRRARALFPRAKRPASGRCPRRDPARAKPGRRRAGADAGGTIAPGQRPDFRWHPDGQAPRSEPKL